MATRNPCLGRTSCRKFVVAATGKEQSQFTETKLVKHHLDASIESSWLSFSICELELTSKCYKCGKHIRFRISTCNRQNTRTIRVSLNAAPNDEEEYQTICRLNPTVLCRGKNLCSRCHPAIPTPHHMEKNVQYALVNVTLGATHQESDRHKLR